MKTLNDWLCDCLCDMVSWMRYIARYPSDAIHGGLEKMTSATISAASCRPVSPHLAHVATVPGRRYRVQLAWPHAELCIGPTRRDAY